VVKVKLHSTAGTVVPGTFLCLHTDGTVLADAGSGARVQVARAVETGVNSQLLDAILINPVSIGA
jgi:hypothetical protein